MNYDLDAAFGSNNVWYRFEPVHITQWDGNSEYFSIQMNVVNGTGGSGALNIMHQNSYLRPKYDIDYSIYSYAENGQHTLTMQCSGRSSTVKILLKVTSDWSS